MRDGKIHSSRLAPITGRLAATLESYIAATQPHIEPAHKLFHTGDRSKLVDKSTGYNRDRRYLSDADISIFGAVRTPTRCGIGFASKTCAIGRLAARTWR